MRNILKTIIAIPVILLLLTLTCGLIITITFLSYLVAVVYLPLKTYSYFKILDEYKRLKE